MEIKLELLLIFFVVSFSCCVALYVVIPKLKRQTKDKMSEKMEAFEAVAGRSKIPLLLLCLFITLDIILKTLLEALMESENIILTILTGLNKTGWFPIIYIVLSSLVLSWRKKKTGKAISPLYIDLAFVLLIVFCFATGTCEEGLFMLAILIGHLWWFDGLDTDEIESIKSEIKSEQQPAIVTFLIVGLVCISLGCVFIHLDVDILNSIFLGVMVGMLSAIVLIFVDPLKRLRQPQEDGKKGRE